MKMSIDKWKHLKWLKSTDLLQTTFGPIGNEKLNSLKERVYKKWLAQAFCWNNFH
jgi:hypothetical protein